MAILKAFSILDVKSDSFSPPFFQPATGQALRAFADLANDKQTTVGRHPADFKLVEIGTFDDNQGMLTRGEHVSLGFALDYVNPGKGA